EPVDQQVGVADEHGGNHQAQPDDVVVAATPGDVVLHPRHDHVGGDEDDGEDCDERGGEQRVGGGQPSVEEQHETGQDGDGDVGGPGELDGDEVGVAVHERRQHPGLGGDRGDQPDHGGPAGGDARDRAGEQRDDGVGDGDGDAGD